jgi:hypothetical protein
MAWTSYAEKETETLGKRAKLQQHLDPFNRPTPRPFPDEDATSYENRALPSLQQCLNGELKDVKIHQVHGYGYQKEARRDKNRESIWLW